MINRHGDLVEFIKLSPTEYHFKVTLKGENKVDFWGFSNEHADPPGGPYVSVGQDLHEYNKFIKKGTIVRQILAKEGKIILVV